MWWRKEGGAVAEPPDLRAGAARWIGPYRLVEEIGRGGSAVVHRAHDSTNGQDVAIKVLAAGYAGEASFCARFRQEAEVFGRMRHPHILEVVDSGETQDGDLGGQPGLAYLVTEHMAQGSLAQHLGAAGDVRARCQLALAVAQQIGAALDHAHAAGVLHRDVKPSNVLIASDGRFVLSDFGLARLLQDGASLQLTATGLVAGTPAYMAPEQALGEPADPRTDLYGLAVVLYEVVAGRAPFHAETPLATMLAHVHQPPPSLQDAAPQTPASVDAVILRALAKHRDDRFQSGGELAEALRAAVVEVFGESSVTTGLLPQLASPPPRQASTQRASDFGAARPRQAPAGRPPARHHARWWSRAARVLAVAAAICSVFVGLAAGGVAFALGPGRPLVADVLNDVVSELMTRFGVAPPEPRWTQASPRDGATDRPLQTLVTIHFSQPMDQDSVREALRVEPSVLVDFEWDGQLLVVMPLEELKPSTAYWVILDTSARDLEGRALVRPLSRRFTTAAVPEPPAPEPPNQAIAAPASPLPAPSTTPEPPTPASSPRPIATVASGPPPAPTATAITRPPPPLPTAEAPPTMQPLGPGERLVAGLLEEGDPADSATPASEAPATVPPARTPGPAASATPIASSTSQLSVPLTTSVPPTPTPPATLGPDITTTPFGTPRGVGTPDPRASGTAGTIPTPATGTPVRPARPSPTGSPGAAPPVATAAGAAGSAPGATGSAGPAGPSATAGSPGTAGPSAPPGTADPPPQETPKPGTPTASNATVSPQPGAQALTPPPAAAFAAPAS